MRIDRRQLIGLGTFGLGAAALPASLALAAAKGFTHNVGSGEPSTSSVLLWTRYVAPQQGQAQLSVEISDSADFASKREAGSAITGPERDHIAKVEVTGLTPGAWFFYRFVAGNGEVSPVGRTRTLPDGAVSRFNLGVFSCSNLPFGYFNAYAHAAERSDLDLMVHTGDYLYEYPIGSYPSQAQALIGRVISPAHEMVQLADYRLRYAAYRSDPDLQRLHQLFPMVAMWDDHELTNDAWKGGAENHQSESEGDWAVRKAVAERVYREWMPVRDLRDGAERWTSYQIGELATLFVTESRISGRDEPVSIAAALAGQEDPVKALTAFRDGEYRNPARQMLGEAQQAWLGGAMQQSTKAGTHWQVLAQQCIMGNLRTPDGIENFVANDAPDFVKQRVKIGALASKLGLPFNFDAWDGYPVAREALLGAAQAADANLIVLTGDSHNGWAFDLPNDGAPAGVEFAGQSVTSPGFESIAPGVDPALIANALIGSNPQLKWADVGSRGYMTVRLTPAAAESEWHFMDTIRQKSTKLSGSTTRRVLKGTNVIGG
jgi:alkaline phosphatase D